MILRLSPALIHLYGVCILGCFSCVWLFETLWIIARQAPLSMGFSRQEYWGRLLCPPPGNLPDPGIEPVSHVSCIGRWVLFFFFNIQNWYPLGLTDLISLQPKCLSRVFSNTTFQKHKFFGSQFSLWSNSHPYMTTGRTIPLTRRTFVGKVMSMLFIFIYLFIFWPAPRPLCFLICYLGWS